MKAERAEHARPQRLKLRAQEGCACHHFLGARIAILRRPAFHDIADIHVTARNSRLGEQAIEELPRAPDERQALSILVRSGRFADEDDTRARTTRAEHHFRARFSENAGCALRSLGCIWR
jgi:hypothetical protein